MSFSKDGLHPNPIVYHYHYFVSSTAKATTGRYQTKCISPPTKSSNLGAGKSNIMICELHNHHYGMDHCRSMINLQGSTITYNLDSTIFGMSLVARFNSGISPQIQPKYQILNTALVVGH